MEQEALIKGYKLLFCTLAFLLVGTFLELKFFQLYNGPFHPFANILKSPELEERKLDFLTLQLKFSVFTKIYNVILM